MKLEQKLSVAVMAFVSIVLLAMFTLHFYPLNLSDSTFVFLQDILIALAALAAASMSFILIQLKTDFRGAWKYLAIGLGAWTIGEFVWFTYENVFGVLNPFPSLADVFWAAGYLPLAIGLAIYIKDIKAEKLFKSFFASVVGVVGTSFALIGLFGFDIFPSKGLLDGILALAYLIGDACLIFLSAILLGGVLKKHGKNEIGLWAFLAVGFLFIAVYDIMFSYIVGNDLTTVGDISNVVYVAAYFFITIAAFLAIKSKSEKIVYPHAEQ